MKTPTAWGLLLLAVPALTCSSSCAQRSSDSVEIDRVMRMYAEAGQFSGAVLVADGSGVVYRGAFGLAHRELGVANTVETRFRIGSITKAFTAILVLQLIEQGHIRLEGAVTDYLTDYSGPGGDRVTVRHLLTHRAGLRDLSDFPRRGNDFPAIIAKVNSGFTDTAELVRLIAAYQPLSDPGEKFSYSNDGYVLLGAIIERVSGKDYATSLRERIFEPAGMRNSGMAYRGPVVTGRASGYDRTFDGYENASPVLVAANGGIYSTIDDLFLWWRALEAGRLLTAESRAVMVTPTEDVTAYGWKVRSTPEAMLIADGSLPGFTSLMVVSESGRRVVIQLTNTREITHRVVDIHGAISRALEGEIVDPPRWSLAEDVAANISELGVDHALRQAEEKQRMPGWYESEPEFNGLGYFLLGGKRIDEAVRVFEWTTQNHPESWNAFDSLGEAYLARGDTAMAARSYRRSLELNPQNSNAAAILARLPPR